MRKKLFNLKFLLMLCMIFVIGGRSVAFAEQTSNLTFSAACKGSGTADDNVEWKITSDAVESTFESTRGIHYGTGSKAVSYLTLTTSGITGSITKIVVNASGASGTSAKLDVTVGGTTFGSQKSLTSSATEYTFEGIASGEIAVKLSQSSAQKALYVKSISVTYSTGSTTTDPSSNLTLSQPTGEVNVGETLNISNYVTKADGYTGTVTYAVTTGAEYASVSEEGVITGLAVGTATVKVTAPAVVGSFSESSAEFTVTVKDNRAATTVTFGSEVDNMTFNVNLGGTFESKTATVSPIGAGNVTYSSDNTEVASVNESTGAITIGNTAGTATITASFAKTATYLASSAKYYINVIDPNALVFYESFDLNDGTGGNDGIWSGFSATSNLKYDKSEWSVVKGYGASQCARFGISDAKGSATTPAIDLSGDKYILTFKAGAWGDDKTTIYVKISKGTLTYNSTSSSTQTITMADAAWTDYSMTIAGATNSTTITFTAKDASNNRFFLDEVKIVKAQAPATSTLSLVAVDNNIYYATFSSSEDVIFPSDVEVDAVSVEGSTLNMTELAKDDYFVKATSADGFDVVTKGYYVPANTGVLIQSLTNTVTYYYPYEEAAVSLPANQLKAAPAGGTINAEKDHVYYKLAYNNYSAKTGLGFYWGAENGGAFSLKAGTAYLDVTTNAELLVKGFCFSGTTTGINNIDATETGKTREIYNLAGQKVNAMTKAGLYIVNGKKIVIRK
ncbi:MAG: Ig-like domain-containing protein [Prevotella sp.]|nr:Ig-like domain-containing protein [Prevotella sp.]